MNSGIRIRISKAHAIACCSILCLFLALFSLGVPAASASADDRHVTDAHYFPVELASSPLSDHSDCDGGLAGMIDHCHATPSCSAYTQAAGSTVSIDPLNCEHPEALSEDDVAGRSPQPNRRPPKRSIQA
jgi:hypothetical protein